MVRPRKHQRTNRNPSLEPARWDLKGPPSQRLRRCEHLHPQPSRPFFSFAIAHSVCSTRRFIGGRGKEGEGPKNKQVSVSAESASTSLFNQKPPPPNFLRSPSQNVASHLKGPKVNEILHAIRQHVEALGVADCANDLSSKGAAYNPLLPLLCPQLIATRSSSR